jgi:hypothetical protein
MTYNAPYYAELIEACGFAKAQDLYAYEMDVALLAKLVDRYKPAVMSVLDGDDFEVRRFDRSHLATEIKTFLEIYNQALEGTWGFTPLQEAEVKHIAAELGHIIAPEFTAFAVVDGKAVGAVLALLDYNQIIRKLDGRLLPFGIFRLMWGRKRINFARAMAMTMVPRVPAIGYQHRAAGSPRRSCQAVGTQGLGVFVGAREQRELARDAQEIGDEADQDLSYLRPGALRAGGLNASVPNRRTCRPGIFVLEIPEVFPDPG